MAHTVGKLDPHEFPGRDCFLSHVSSDDEGWVVGDYLEAPVNIRDFRPAISVKVLRQLAQRHAGMHTSGQFKDLEDELCRLQDEVTRLEEELQEADSVLQGVDALAKKGYTLKRSPGRPKTKPAKEAV